ncbi:MAG: hypothetical protein ACFE0S_09895 [Rhodospirillales bacterium]
MRIGIDFDNTITDYSGVFARVAIELGMLDAGFSGAKTDVRETLRERPGGEQTWQRLQGQVYGRFMPLARPMPGVGNFLAACLEHDAKVCVISHKTEYGHFDAARINLRDAAMAWLEENGFFDPARSPLRAEDVGFHATRAEKTRAISDAGVDHFIDDLKEVFDDPGFPAATAAHLLGGSGGHGWNDIREAVFGA